MDHTLCKIYNHNCISSCIRSSNDSVMKTFEAAKTAPSIKLPRMSGIKIWYFVTPDYPTKCEHLLTRNLQYKKK